MSRSTASPLRIENLETRCVPALFGIPWANPTQLKVSFAPDGTTVDGVGSTLFAKMQADGLTAATWQGEVSRALQTWTAQANVNVGLMADGGQAIDSAGPGQGDTRFGDIRVAARPLGTQVLAIATPPGILGGTRAGDIILNTNYKFSKGGATGTYDLYSVLLQEVGHALGVGNSTDPASPMYEVYSGARTGITANDGGSLRALYGARVTDAQEGTTDNDVVARAATISLVASLSSTSAVYLKSTAGELTTSKDVDFYKFTTPTKTPSTVTVSVRANGYSQLLPKLTVYASNQTTVKGTATATSSQANDAVVTLTGVTAGQVYYIKVEKGSTTFDIGSYQAQIGFNATKGVPALAVISYVNDSNTNETTATATTLASFTGYTANSYYKTSARLKDSADVDFYKVRSPAATKQSLTVLMRSVDAANPFRPKVDVYNAAGQLVASQVLVAGNGEYVVQVTNSTPNVDYFLRASGTVTTGQVPNYVLDADFLTSAVVVKQVENASLTNAATTAYATLTVAAPEVVVLNLAATSANANETAMVRVTIFDANGLAVADFAARGGDSITTELYLGAGRYVVRIQGIKGSGQTSLPTLGYKLCVAVLSDPIGPTQTIGSGTPDVLWSKEALSVYTNSMMYDPVGPPLM